MAKFKDVSGTYDTGRKATRIAVGFSPTEFARIKRWAREKNITVTQAIRNLALKTLVSAERAA